MKQKIFLALFLIFSFSSFGQETQTSDEYPLTITVVGTNNYSDVNLIIKNLKRSLQIGRLSLSLSSKDLSEFSGSYRGSAESLVEEIQGLAQDRFAVEVSKQKGKQSPNMLSITLRKLPSETPPR